MPKPVLSAKPKGSGARTRQVPGEEYLVKRAGSSVWHIAFRIGNHRFRASSGTADREAAAGLAAKRWQEEWDRIMLGVELVPEMTLNEAFVRYYREKGKGTSWGDGGQKYILAVILELLGPKTLLSALDDAKVNDLVQGVRTRQHGQEGRGPRTQDASPATINRYLASLSGVCKRARALWKVQVGDWSLKEHVQREPEGREVFLDHAQARRLMDAAVGHLKPILLLALMTGLRRDNVLRLDWDSIGMDVGRAVLMQKGDRRLGIALPDGAVQLLARIQPDPAKRRGRVFTFGNPNTPCQCPTCRCPSRVGEGINSVRRAFSTAAREAGVRDMPAGRLRFHDLRHTFASWLLGTGQGDLKVVQEALGHANIATSARYTHLLAGRKEAVIAAATAGLLEAPAGEGRKAG